LIIEFFTRNSERAVHALDPTIFIGVDPELDADVAKKSVQFAIDNSAGTEDSLYLLVVHSTEPLTSLSDPFHRQEMRVTRG
jgi:hypothetical protein